ncbi:MAG: Do family serine endopeptidase [Deltaproteobacteria bacterium]|nr:Do family serine endopeptidase [Deltaproteobacteria bacterium]
MKRLFSLVTFTSLTSLILSAPIFASDKVWSEKENTAPALVNLPDFAPLIDQLDQTIVNVAGTSDPAAQQQQQQKQKMRGRGPQQQPEQFMGPDDFFEKFFGNPFREENPQPRRTLGSGFIISKDGYILTNNHVVEGTDKIEITLLDGAKGARKNANKFQATIVGRDPATDVALLKIKTGFDLPFAYLGNSSKIKKGDWALAFGNPFGLDHSVSAGIISAIGREISPNENRRFDDFIQTDAAINFGNSGGPLVNLKGEVIGINTAITAQGSGIGFAVPINIAKDVASQLKDSGTVARGYLGVMIQDVSEEIKEGMGLKEARGVLVNDVVADGPAAKSALQRGDVIIKVGTTDVNDTKTLQKTIARIKPGNSVDLEVIRDKKPIKLSLKVGTLNDVTGEKDQKSDVAPGKADKLGLVVGLTSDKSAVQIQEIDDQSAAFQAGMAPGDVIRRINGQAVKSLDQYKKAVASMKSKQTALFDLERKTLKLFIAFRVP